MSHATTTGSVDLNLALIVGAQRSGTTWLQMLCAAHAKIAGGEELHLFSRYLVSLVTAYYSDRQKYGNAGRSQGLPCLLTTEEFDAAVKQFAVTCLSKLLRCKSGAQLAIEKTPDHVLHLNYIRHLFPKTKVIHVIRDPRDVVVSQLAAAASWGDEWAPKTPAAAAEIWVEWVSAGRKHAWGNYTEVRYETLLGDGPRELSRVYDFLGHPLPPEEVQRIYEQFTMANIKSGKSPNVLVAQRQELPAPVAPKEAGSATPPSPSPSPSTPPQPRRASPTGFFRQGKAGGWRESLGAEDIRAIERITGPLMRELGYPTNTSPDAPSPPAAAG